MWIPKECRAKTGMTTFPELTWHTAPPPSPTPLSKACEGRFIHLTNVDLLGSKDTRPLGYRDELAPPPLGS